MIIDFISNPSVRETAEWLTIVVSLLGVSICLVHAAFFRNGADKLSAKLRSVFLTDAAVYFVTLVMGIGLFFDLSAVVWADVIIRPFILFLNVYASVRLYKHYKLMAKLKE